MGGGVIVYLSTRESGEQKATKTDEVLTEHTGKTKNSAQKRSVKIPRKTSKKVLDKRRLMC